MNWPAARARPEIVALDGYVPPPVGPGLERLDANELPWDPDGRDPDRGLNRYPEPQPPALVARLAALYGIDPSSVLLGRGSSEAIDLLCRVFCRPGRDAVVICAPTFALYAQAARVQGARVEAVPLAAERGFALDADAVLDRATRATKLVFLCSPNNPTGNLLDGAAIARVAAALAETALVVVDEAYIEFSSRPSLAARLAAWPNVAVLRTLSKAYGLAGARCGALLADPAVIALARKILPPYAVPRPTVSAALAGLSPAALARRRSEIVTLVRERARLERALAALPGVTRVWPSEANFVLAEFADPDRALARARAAGLLVRDARTAPLLPRALRVSVGTPAQNTRLLEAWS